MWQLISSSPLYDVTDVNQVRKVLKEYFEPREMKEAA